MKYSEKILTLGRHNYDRDSKEFQRGAWRWLSQEESERNLRALKREMA